MDRNRNFLRSGGIYCAFAPSSAILKIALFKNSKFHLFAGCMNSNQTEKLKIKSNHLVIISIIWLALFIIVAEIVAPKEYNLVNHTISKLATQSYENRWIMQTSFLGFAIIFIFAQIYKFCEKRKTFWPDFFLIISAIFFLPITFLSVQSFDQSIPFSIKEDLWHNILAIILVSFFSLGMAGYMLKSQGKNRFYHFIFLLLILITSLLFVLSQNGIIPYLGLIQRAMFLVSLSWLIWVNRQTKESTT